MSTNSKKAGILIGSAVILLSVVSCGQWKENDTIPAGNMQSTHDVTVKLTLTPEPTNGEEEKQKDSNADNHSNGQQTSVTPVPTEEPVTLTPTPVPTEEPVTSTPTPEPTATPIPTPIEIGKYAEYDNTKYEWWFRRNTTHEQSGSGEGFDIDPFDAYYVDEQVTDEDKVFYLTFDCGYEMGFTPGILDVLKKYNAPATFFVTQSFLKSHPDYVKRMKEEGHLVGNHTVKHLSMPDMTTEEIQNELATVANTMLELTGYEIDSFFRPPMGEYSKRTLQVTKDLGYKSIFWSIAYYDYDVNDQPGKEYVINHFRDYHHNGCIALIHNTSESNAQALDEVLQLLLNEGYRFGSLEELQ